jgi:tRNA(Arg) A34 adenosine deaminase TadA
MPGRLFVCPLELLSACHHSQTLFVILILMTTDSHLSFMQEAYKQAILAKRDGELPFGAVVVQNGVVIARGRCREAKRHTVLAHAEAEVVDKACRKLGTTKLTDCTIYCTNEPCPMCAAAIFQAKIPFVVIGASRGDLSFLRPRTIDIQVLADDSGYDITIIRDIMKQSVIELFTKRN